MKLRVIIFMVLGLSLINQAGAQYFYVMFTGSRDGNAAVDISVHATLLNDPKKPKYSFHITDKLGMIRLTDSGSYLIQVAYPGFKTFQDTLFINNPKSNPLKITLSALDFDLNEVVVTGQFDIKTEDKSLNKVKVIDRQRIESQGAITLKDVLSNELNIRLNNDPILGAGLSLQGISGQNIKILIDGVPLIGRMDGNIDLSQINLANIERIEIIEGPMSVMYGTDALGGVINLITKKSTRHTFEFDQRSYTESNGTYNFDGRVGFRKKKWNAQIAGGRNFFSGQAVGDEIRNLTWKPREQRFADAVIGTKVGNSLHRVQSSIFWEKLSSRGEAVVTPYQAYGFDQYFFTQRINNALYSDFRINRHTTLSLIESYSWFSRIKNTYRKDLVNLEQKLTGDPDDQDTAKFDLWLFRGILTHQFNKKLDLQVGYEVNLESAKGQRIASDQQAIQDYALFTSAEYKPITRLSLKPGVRFIYNSRYGAPIIPALNAKYDITSKIAVRASWAKGFRAPSLKELSLLFVDVNHNVQGNGELRAETSNNYTASITWKSSLGKWNFKLEPSFFRNEISDMINLALVNAQTQLYKYVNLTNFKSQGMSVSADAIKKGLRLNLGYSLVGRFNEATGANRFVYSPEYRVNMHYTIPRIKTDVSLFFKATGATPGFTMTENNQVLETRIDAYQNLDLTLSRDCWKRRVKVVVGAKNLMNVTNVNFSGAANGGVHSGGGSSLPLNMGRTYFASLRFQFINMK